MIPDAGPPVEPPRMTQAERRAAIERAQAIAQSAKTAKDKDKEDLANMLVRVLETG